MNCIFVWNDTLVAGGKGKTDHEAKGSSEHVHTDEGGRGTEEVVVHVHVQWRQRILLAAGVSVLLVIFI